jgi:hypothetical protein
VTNRARWGWKIEKFWWVGCLASELQHAKLQPSRKGQTSLKKKGTNHIVNGANDTLSATVMRDGVGARHAKMYVVGEEEGARAGVIELAAIVALESLYGDTELCTHKGKETS